MKYVVQTVLLCAHVFFVAQCLSFSPLCRINGISRCHRRNSVSLKQHEVNRPGATSHSHSISKGFILSPSSPYEDNKGDLMILDHFSQIQLGEKSKIGIIGTQELSQAHQQMVELLSYALVLSGNHVYTSGGGNGMNGTNLAVIRGALRACNTDLITVILPQRIHYQPAELQLLLSRVTQLIQMPENDEMDLKEAANMCNLKILDHVDKALAFLFHGSKTLLNSLENASDHIEIIKFFLD